MVNDVQRGKTSFWILIGVLAISGISMAFIVIFGMFDSIAFSIVWRVFIADVYLIAALAAQHNWLRWTVWIGTGVTFILGLVAVFWRFTPYYQWADERRSFIVGDPNSGWSSWFGFEQDLELAAHLAMIGLVLLGFISLAYRWVETLRVLHAIYVFTFVTGLASILLGVFLVLDAPQRWNLSDGLGQINAGIIILALTGAAIVIIAAFVQRKAARARAVMQAFPTVVAGVVANTADHYGPQDQRSQQLAPASLAHLTPDELRVLVRQYVDDYLRERDER